MKRSALLIAVLVLVVSGCGGGSSSTTAPSTGGGQSKKATAPNAGAPAGSRVLACADGLRATAIDCDSARQAMSRWKRARSCSPHGSRSSCALGKFRCQAVQVEKGTSVSCVRPGAVVDFIAKPAG
jgi:hypothetical protein